MKRSRKNQEDGNITWQLAYYSVTYSIIVESHIDGEDYEDEYDPESQSWDDIEDCFANVCSEVEDDEPAFEYQYSWEINDFQPACMYEDDKGNTIEVYVSCCG